MKKADSYFSQYIRQRDSDEYGYGECITCRKRLHWKQAHCGHFVPRGKQSTRYDERNTNLQCASCNTYRYGEQYLHGRAIDEKFGDGTADDLFKISRKETKRTKLDFEHIASYYKDLIK